MRFFLFLIVVLWTGLAMATASVESLLLATLGARAIPQALLLASLLTLAGSLTSARLLRSHSAGRVLQANLALSAAIEVICFVGLEAGQSWLCLPLYAFYCANFALTSSQVFALAGECIDTYSSKRLFPILAAGTTVGELIGGMVVSQLGHRVTPSQWLLTWSLLEVSGLLWLSGQNWQRWRQTLPQVRRPRAALPGLTGYIQQGSMARSLALLLVSMVACQALSQYLVSQALVRHFPQAQQMAVFMGALVLWTNVAELFIATMVTPRLLNRLGVARAGWIHPLAKIFSLAIFQLYSGLTPAIFLWVCRRTLQDCLGGPCRNLLYNAIPSRLRALLRTFLDGVVVSTAQAASALLLMALQACLSLTQLGWLAWVTALIYLGTSVAAGRNYLRSLVRDVQGEGLLLAHPASPSAHSALPAGRTLEMLGRGLQGPEASTCLASLANHPDPLAISLLAGALQHSQSELRHQAAHHLSQRGPAAVTAIQPYLFSDQATTVEAALAALGLGPAEWSRELLQCQFRLHLRTAARCWLDQFEVLRGDLTPRGVLWLALRDAFRVHQRLAFTSLCWLEGRELVESLRLAINSASQRRAAALEVLSNLNERASAQIFVALLEPNSDDQRQRTLASLIGAEGDSLESRAKHSPDKWTRLAAGNRLAPRQVRELLCLSGCQLLDDIELDRLEQIRLACRPETLPAGTALLESGQEVRRAWFVEGEPAFLGGLELLSGLPAQHTWALGGTALALSLDRAGLEQLLLQVPSLSPPLFRWLSQELRRREKDLEGPPIPEVREDGPRR